jgi:hypothetical protein
MFAAYYCREMTKTVSQILRRFYRKFKGKTYILLLKENLAGQKSILDCGCGRSSPIKDVPLKSYTVGVDLFKPALIESKKAKIHENYVLADINNLCFKPKSFSAVVALDFLEHLEKADGYWVIRSMEELATDSVLIVTPNGFLLQSAHGGNVFQVHLSGWRTEELERLGFEVYGVNGLKFLRKEEAVIRFRPKAIFSEVSIVSQKLAYRFPKIAFQLLAVKKKRRKP